MKGRAIVGLAWLMAASLACARPGPPSQLPTAGESSPDGGLPLPPRSAKRGVIVPSDMGLGAGVAGPSSSTGPLPPPGPPASGPPSVGN